MFQSGIDHVLLIDDDKDDCSLFENALHKVSPDIKFDCLNHARGIDSISSSHPPDIIFLDLNIASESGLDVLDELRKINVLKRIPVVVYSGSQSSRDIAAAYGFGANLYFQKPYSLHELTEGLKKILQLDWYHPDSVTADYFKEGKYEAFISV
jgi:DNA-binding response OmpR family regulator